MLVERGMLRGKKRDSAIYGESVIRLGEGGGGRESGYVYKPIGERFCVFLGGGGERQGVVDDDGLFLRERVS